MLIIDVQPGDTIKESGSKGFEVKNVDRVGCSPRGLKVHINERFCYDVNAEVQVLQGRKDDELVDWDIDNDVLAELDSGVLV